MYISPYDSIEELEDQLEEAKITQKHYNVAYVSAALFLLVLWPITIVCEVFFISGNASGSLFVVSGIITGLILIFATVFSTEKFEADKHVRKLQRAINRKYLKKAEEEFGS